MALTDSTQVALGTTCPDFNLPAVDGENYRLADFQDKQVLIVIFTCNHCPYAQAVEDRIIKLQRDFSQQSVQLVAVCSNDPDYVPADSFENLKKRWLEKDYRFPYLHDLGQDVARAFGAVCTPEFYVWGPDRKLAYHGRLDDNWKEPLKVKKQDLREAVAALLNGKQPASEQIPSLGCSIKWRTS
ncbi:MAG: thioredoxin family protein [bacterium]|nr:thioredoxin family protein [bacterium]